jgi:succinate-semialdehyde dehydrogenase/glutarate-semialdehyde dehydrogenase
VATTTSAGGRAALEPGSVERAVAAARRAHEHWRLSDLPARAAVLRAVERAVRSHADAIVETIVAETGKPRTEAVANELYAAVDRAAWLGRELPDVLRDERLRFRQLHLKTKKAWLVYEPLGVVAAITPWNIPFALPFVQAAAAVAAGNGVVVKPSELTPRCAEWVPRLLEEAGVPAGLVQVVPGEADAGEALVAEPGIAKVFFTGSVAGGRAVAAAAGARGCPVVLELGGRDALVVFADADLERAVDGAAFAAFLNAGQACVSAERIYVERPLYDGFVRRLEERAADLELGPLSSDAHVARVRGLTGAPLAARGGRFVEPTIVRGALPDEEIFGPVVTVEPFDGEDDAVARANDTKFGLGASVWTRDLAKAGRVARRIEAGMVWVNDFGYSFAAGQASWGGVTASGFGRTGSKHGLYECVRVKYIDSDGGRLRPPWWLPYDDETARALRTALDVLYGARGARLRAAWRARRELRRLVRRSS